MLGIAVILRAAIGRRPGELDLPFVEEGHDPDIQEIGRGNRRPAVVKSGKRHFRSGVDEGLLVDAANALHVADIERVVV